MHSIQSQKGEQNTFKPKTSRIRQSEEFLQRCFHFSPSNGEGGGEVAGMPIRADEREREGRKSIIIPLGMRTSTRDRQWERARRQRRRMKNESDGIQQSN